MNNTPTVKDSSGNVVAGPSSWGGGPPGGGGSDMESRVAALEKTTVDIREKLVRVETKLEGIEKTMATKADLADLRTVIADGFTSQTKWFISTAIALAVIAFTAAKFIHA
ncbi:hypothetical protein RA263_14595 [Pseudomonas syringae pv. tagetis]|uniref:Hemolysin XhlA n=1 Tax=Pseudomonas syringae pv. tagetis TaxID=129140 RepID=A0ABW7NL84_9PSED|nr:hypothetical protein [Pseudomonas syringae group genomosp. 7]RMW08800.1 hypothetical protein ALO98_200376 [Pseudomonas syringae pv. tagetis]UNB70268.1 hypothetical protein MME58_08620 [Pseudomonas syringae pv. tagetis]